MRVQELDEREAEFHNFENAISDGGLLNTDFERKLDSALATIPQKVRDFLEVLADDYDLSELGKVLVLAEHQGLCLDDGSTVASSSQNGPFSYDEIRRAWFFIRCYRMTHGLVAELNRQASEVLNPPSTKTEKTYWWLAINGSSCAVSPMPLPDTVVVRPQPHTLLGYQTQAEQLKDQQFFLTASIEEIARYQNGPMRKKVASGEVRFKGCAMPDVPTKGPTCWLSGAAMGS
jgi:hypothetical protein